MRTLEEHLTQYASYHRDRRNIATHFVGIPMIVVAIATLLAKPSIVVAGVTLAPVVAVTLAIVLFYLRLDLRFGLVMTAIMAASTATGLWLATLPMLTWAASGLGLFVVGWVIQFWGHYYEGRKPAFVDDLVGLIIGPLFITTEAAFMLGLRRDLLHVIEAKVGPTRINEKKSAKAAV